MTSKGNMIWRHAQLIQNKKRYFVTSSKDWVDIVHLLVNPNIFKRFYLF